MSLCVCVSLVHARMAPIRVGYLTKEPVHKKAFAITQSARRRFFVLRAESLEWHADETKAGGLPKGRVMLEGARIARLGPELILGSGDERLVVRGSDIDGWEATLKAAINKASGIDPDPEPSAGGAAASGPEAAGRAASATCGSLTLDAAGQRTLEDVDELFQSGPPPPPHSKPSAECLAAAMSSPSLSSRGSRRGSAYQPAIPSGASSHAACRHKQKSRSPDGGCWTIKAMGRRIVWRKRIVWYCLGGGLVCLERD